MKSVLGIVVVLAIVGVGGGLIWLNSFVHSDSFRHEVETRASAEIKGTVEITKIDVGLFSGVKLEGLVTKLVTEQGTVVANVANVSCSYSLSALLSKRLDLNGLTVTNPDIVLTQQAPASITTPHATPTAATAGPEAKTPPFDFSLDTAKIKDGHLAIKNAAGATKADLTGIQVMANTADYFAGKDVTGTLEIATIALPQNLSLTAVSTSFAGRADAIEVKPIVATTCGGTINASYNFAIGGPSLMTVNASKIDMLQVGQAANPTSPTKLSGLLDFQSTFHGVETGKLTGEGDAQISAGKLEGVTILNELSTAFRIPEMHDPVIKSVTTHFEVADGTTRFDHLVIESTSFKMTGSGTIDPAGNLKADMLLTLNADAFQKVPEIATGFFTKLPEGGGSIAFQLSGTAANPESDTLTKLFINGSKAEKTISKTFKDLFK